MKILMLIANDDLDDCKNCIASGLNVDYGDDNDEDLLASRLNKGNSDDLDTGSYDYDVDGDDVDATYGTNLLAATLKSSKDMMVMVMVMVIMMSMVMVMMLTAPTYLPPHARAPRV